MLLGVLPLLCLLSVVRAQFSGTWHLNVTTRDSGAPGSGCIVLAQIATLSAPNTITAMKPICPPTAPNPSADGGEAVTWPLSADGDGDVSSLAVYGDLPGGDDDPMRPGCVMFLEQMQVAYILGRDLQWDSTLGQMMDLTGKGALLDPKSFATMICHRLHPYLNDALALSSPNKHKKDESIWWQAVTVPGLGEGAMPSASSSATPSTSIAASTDSAESRSSADPASTTSFRFIDTSATKSGADTTASSTSFTDTTSQESILISAATQEQITKVPMSSSVSEEAAQPAASPSTTPFRESLADNQVSIATSTGSTTMLTSTMSANTATTDVAPSPETTVAPAEESGNGESATEILPSSSMISEVTPPFAAGQTSLTSSEQPTRPSVSASSDVQLVPSSSTSMIGPTKQASVSASSTPVIAAMTTIAIAAPTETSIIDSSSQTVTNTLPSLATQPAPKTSETSASAVQDSTTIASQTTTSTPVTSATSRTVMQDGEQPAAIPPNPSSERTSAAGAGTSPLTNSSSGSRDAEARTSESPRPVIPTQHSDASSESAYPSSELGSQATSATQPEETKSSSSTGPIVSLSTVGKAQTRVSAFSNVVEGSLSASPIMQTGPADSARATREVETTTFPAVTGHLPHNVTSGSQRESQGIGGSLTTLGYITSTSRSAITTSITRSSFIKGEKPISSFTSVASSLTPSPKTTRTTLRPTAAAVTTSDPVSTAAGSSSSTKTASTTQHLCCDTVISVQDRDTVIMTLTTSVTCTPCSQATTRTRTSTTSITKARTTPDPPSKAPDAGPDLTHTQGDNEPVAIITTQSGATSTPKPSLTSSPKQAPSVTSTVLTSSIQSQVAVASPDTMPVTEPEPTPPPLAAPTFDDDASPFRDLGIFPFSASLELVRRQRGGGRRGGAREAPPYRGWAYRGGATPGVNDQGGVAAQVQDEVGRVDYEVSEHGPPGEDAEYAFNPGYEITRPQEWVDESSIYEPSDRSDSVVTSVVGVTSAVANTQTPASTAQRDTVLSITKPTPVASETTARVAEATGRQASQSSVGPIDPTDSGNNETAASTPPSLVSAVSTAVRSSTQVTSSVPTSDLIYVSVHTSASTSGTVTIPRTTSSGTMKTGGYSSILLVEPSANGPSPKVDAPTSNTGTTNENAASDLTSATAASTSSSSTSGTTRSTSPSTSSKAATSSSWSSSSSLSDARMSSSSRPSLNHTASSTSAPLESGPITSAATSTSQATTSTPAKSEQQSPLSSSSTPEISSTEPAPPPPQSTEEPSQSTEELPQSTEQPLPPTPSPGPSPEPIPSDPVFSDAGATIGQFVTSLLSAETDDSTPPTEPQQGQSGSDVTVIGQFTPTGDVPGLAQATQTLALAARRESSRRIMREPKFADVNHVASVESAFNEFDHANPRQRRSRSRRRMSSQS